MNPRPSSRIRKVTPSPPETASIRTRDAFACFAALATASWAIRYKRARMSGSGSFVIASTTSTTQSLAFALRSRYTRRGGTGPPRLGVRAGGGNEALPVEGGGAELEEHRAESLDRRMHLGLDTRDRLRRDRA